MKAKKEVLKPEAEIELELEPDLEDYEEEPVINLCNELVEILDTKQLHIAYRSTSLVLLDLISELLMYGATNSEQNAVISEVNAFHNEFIEVLSNHGYNFGNQTIN